MSEEDSTDEREVLLPSCSQMNAGEHAIDCKAQGRNENLGEMHVDFTLAVDSGHILTIDNWKFQCGSETGIDTTREGARIHQSGPSIPGKAGRGGGTGPVVWVEAYLDMQSRTEPHQQIPPECSRLILEPTINHRLREPVDTERKPAASMAARRSA